MEQTRNKGQAPNCPLCWLDGKVGQLEVVGDDPGAKAAGCTRCHWMAWQGDLPDPDASALADDLDCCPTVGAPKVRAVPEHLAHRIALALRRAATDAQGWFTPPRLNS